MKRMGTVSALISLAVVILFAVFSMETEEKPYEIDKSVAESESISNESNEMEIGLVSESVVITGTPLEMAKKVVSEEFLKQKDLGYIKWRIDSLTDEFFYEGTKESYGDVRANVYYLKYSFQAKNPSQIEFTDNIYLCVVADGGSLSYMIMEENDSVPGTDTFVEKLKSALGVMEETAEDYYDMVTSASAMEVEQFAAGIKEDILFKDWESLSQKLAYPIRIGEKSIDGKDDFLSLDINADLNQNFLDAIDAESCKEMFFNYQGIMMGENGQIWISEVDTGNGQWELKVIALNGLIR